MTPYTLENNNVTSRRTLAKRAVFIYVFIFATCFLTWTFISFLGLPTITLPYRAPSYPEDNKLLYSAVLSAPVGFICSYGLNYALSFIRQETMALLLVLVCSAFATGTLGGMLVVFNDMQVGFFPGLGGSIKYLMEGFFLGALWFPIIVVTSMPANIAVLGFLVGAIKLSERLFPANP